MSFPSLCLVVILWYIDFYIICRCLDTFRFCSVKTIHIYIYIHFGTPVTKIRATPCSGKGIAGMPVPMRADKYVYIKYGSQVIATVIVFIRNNVTYGESIISYLALA